MAIFTATAALKLKEILEEVVAKEPARCPSYWSNLLWTDAAAPDREQLVATAKSIQSYLYGAWDECPRLETPVIDFEPEAKKCTCGVQHTGGIHSDWCDLERDV